MSETDECARGTTWLQWIWLSVGTLMALLCNGRWLWPPAVWLAPVFLLRLTYTRKPTSSLPLGGLAMAVVYIISWRGVTAVEGLLYVVLFAWMGLVFWLPYCVERLVAPRIRGFGATLVFPLSYVSVMLACVLTSPVDSNILVANYIYALPLRQIVSITSIWGIVFLIYWTASVINWAWERGFAWASIRRGVLVCLGVLVGTLLVGETRLVVRQLLSSESTAMATASPTQADISEVSMDSTPTPRCSTWKLVWSDEFDGPTIDTSNWGYEIGFVRNYESQYYTDSPENAYIEDGNLVIRAERDGFSYTSASLTTEGRREFEQGRFEMRARIPTAAGAWPAWWALGSNKPTVGYPECGAIDMMEFYRDQLQFNIHTSTNRVYSASTPFTDSTHYHTWIMEWDADSIRLYLDDVLMNDFDLSDATIGDYNPFRQEYYMKVNLAIGGDSGGDPSGTTFPQLFYIDYVRVYERCDG